MVVGRQGPRAIRGMYVQVTPFSFGEGSKENCAADENY